MSRNAAIAVLTFVGLCAIPVLLLLAVDSELHFFPALSILGVVVVYTSAHLAEVAASYKQRIITTTFWGFSYIFLAVAPFLQVATNTFPWEDAYQDIALTKSALIILVGLLAFDVGRCLIPAIGAPVPRTLKRSLGGSAIVLLAIGALAAAPSILSRVGGLASLLIPRGERNRQLMSEFDLPELMLLNHALSTPVYVLGVAAVAIWVARRARGLEVSIRWKAMTCTLLVATLILNNPISTARFKVGTILLSIFFMLPWRRWSSVVTVWAIVGVFLFIFPFADLFRNSLGARLSERISETSTVLELTENGDFDAFQMVVNGVAVVDQSGFQLGQQIGGALLFWVPRSFWPNKPISTGQWVAEKKGYRYTNLSSPLWAELYIDGGWVYLILGFVGYGYMVRTIDRWHALSSGVGLPQVVSIIVPIYAGYQFFLLRGALMSAIAYFAPILLMAMLCSVYVYRGPVNLARQPRVLASTDSKNRLEVRR